MSYNSELQSNNADLRAILDAVNNLPEAGSGVTVETCSVVIKSDLLGRPVFTYTAFENGQLVTKQTDAALEWSDEYGTQIAIFDNVVRGTGIIFIADQVYSVKCENAEVGIVSEWFAENLGMPSYNIKILGDAVIEVVWE